MEDLPASPPPTTPAASGKTSAEDKVPVAQKLAYGLGTFHDMWGHWLYPGFANLVFNIFLGVSPALVTTAGMLNRLFDAASDPFFGWLSDNTRTRWGRRRPYILIGGILAGIGLPLLFYVRPGWREHSYFWFMLASSAIFIPVMSAFNMPFQSLGSEMTPDYHERTSVFKYKNAVQKIPELAMFFAAQFATMAVWVGATHHNALHRLWLLATTASAWHKADPGASPNILIGAQAYCAILGALMVLAAIIVFAVLRERYYGQVVASNQAKVSIKETLWQALSCKPFRTLLFMSLAYSLGLSMVGNLGFYDTVYYVCHGDVAAGAVWNFKMGIAGMVFGFLGLLMFAPVARRIGKRNGMACVLLVCISVFIAAWWLYNPNYPWLQPLASGLIALTSAGFYMLQGSILADVIDFDETESHKRREGSFNACLSWIQKVGMALGFGASGWILAATGFDAKLHGAQTPHAIFMIRLMFSALPLAGLAISLVGILRFPLTQKKMTEIRAQLEMQRGKV
jgi:GPH family glycoside/pentoside/hexuronide:cation symporter